MPKDFSRTRRVGEALQRELARLIQFELQDPRFKMVTVSAVDVSRDLAYAKVYFTLLDDTLAVSNVEEALNKAGGFLRKELGKCLSMRHVPGFKFIYDKSVRHGNALSSLINAAIEDDKHKRGED